MSKKSVTKSVSNTATNWGVLLSDNRTAVEDFAKGSSLRTMISGLSSDAARSEAYALERYVGAQKGRERARKALSRRSS